MKPIDPLPANKAIRPIREVGVLAAIGHRRVGFIVARFATAHAFAKKLPVELSKQQHIFVIVNVIFNFSTCTAKLSQKFSALAF